MASFSLEQAKTVFTHPALQYNYIVDGIPNVDPIYVTSAQLPSKAVDDITVKVRGRTLHYNGNIPNYSDIQLTFTEDISYTTRTSLELWMQTMADNETGYGFLTPMISKTINLYLMAPGSDTIIAAYALHNAWIKNLTNISLGYSNTTQVVTYSTTVVFDYFVRSDIAGFSNFSNIAGSLGL